MNTGIVRVRSLDTIIKMMKAWPPSILSTLGAHESVARLRESLCLCRLGLTPVH